MRAALTELEERRNALFILPLLLLLLLFAMLTGCTYVKNWMRVEKLRGEVKKNPNPELIRELAPEGCYQLGGLFVSDRTIEKPLLIVVVSRKSGRPEIVTERVMRAPVVGYVILLPVGNYELFVFADLDHNGFFEKSEVIGHTKQTAQVRISADRSSDGFLVQGPSIILDFKQPESSDFPIQFKVTASNMIFKSLDDEFFDPRYGTIGLYNPVEFSSHTQGSMFGLEDYDPQKTMVLFVHGATGTPRDWKFFVEKLDRKRFQPWFYYYPSGMPLEKLGIRLAFTIKYIKQRPEYMLNRLVIVAHSMGGLVSRAAINLLCKEGAPEYLKGYISFSTPYGGVEGAKQGVKHAPVVVPSWRDVAPGSDFLTRLYQQKFPESVPFYLFFGYRGKGGESSDGTIALSSQLDLRAQDSASRVYGFNDTHTGILNDQTVAKVLFGILETVALRENGRSH